MEKDHRDLLSEFNRHNVEYVIVGGVAVSAHGIPRYTKDLDLLIRASKKNSELVHRALAAFGAPIHDTDPAELRDGTTVLQLGAEPNRIDILQAISGVDFDQVWQNRVLAKIDSSVTAPLISKEDLIQNKLKAGRPRDLADVAELRSIQPKIVSSE
jgi:Nucleotidyl transferase of unknown function (DUF2204)